MFKRLVIASGKGPARRKLLKTFSRSHAFKNILLTCLLPGSVVRQESVMNNNVAMACMGHGMGFG